MAPASPTTSHQPAFTPRRPHGRPLPLHVLFVPAVPVLALWAGNASKVHTMLPVRIAVWSVVVCLVLVATLTVVQRDLRRSGLIATMVVFTFSVYGHAFTPNSWFGPLIVATAFGAVLILSARMRDQPLATITHVLNVVAIALVLANGALVLLERPDATTGPLPEAIAPAPTTAGPDVWYIAPDRYPDLALLEDLGVDNRGFAGELEARGFTVLEDAYANYPATSLSLASAWHAQYLDLDESGRVVSNATELLRDPLIGQLFVEAGYDYHHLGTWFDDTAGSASATSVLTLQLGQEFWVAYEATTMLPTLGRLSPALRTAHVDHITERQVRHGRHQLHTLRALAAREPPGPEFVLTHITLPHPPYVFDVDGSPLPDPWPTPGRADAYEKQLAFFNEELLDIIDRLQARADPPIIVLLPDEGVYPEDLHDLNKADYDLGALTPEQAREKMSIMAAVFDPDPTHRRSYPQGFTAVNVTRNLFNRALGTDLEPVDDVIYIWHRVDDGLVLVPADL